jgi:hypothetical protein
MSLIPWKNKHSESSHDLTTWSGFRHEMDRLFDSFFRDPLAPWSGRGWFEAWGPAVDVTQLIVHRQNASTARC